ncbi:hypothetical protein ALC62_13527, partial [Cyphomyrmex costatus]
YFRFPFDREDHLKKWMEAIGQADFEPIKTDVICSAHFIPNDYMDRDGDSTPPTVNKYYL